jgi:hypothetical protein
VSRMDHEHGPVLDAIAPTVNAAIPLTVRPGISRAGARTYECARFWAMASSAMTCSRREGLRPVVPLGPRNTSTAGRA